MTGNKQSQNLDPQEKRSRYENIIERIKALLDGVDDEVAALATVACELHNGLPGFHWTGFYRVTAPEVLTVGPYQGGHGCLTIPFHRGICGESARKKATLRIDDVHAQADHIACSTTTNSELVVPVFDQQGEIAAVLDIDSDFPAHFDEIDVEYCEKIAASLTRFYPGDV